MNGANSCVDKQEPSTTSDSDSRPVITWLILVYERIAEKRFPLKRKWYRFNYSKATEQEAREVIGLCRRPRGSPPADSKINMRITQVTYQLGTSGGTSRRILRYRHLFEFVPDIKQAFSKYECSEEFSTVSFSPDSYFEDENEIPITIVQISDEELSRRDGEGALAVVFDHPESILRLGAALPIRSNLWQETDADLIFHLFEVYRQVRSGRWLKSKCIISSNSKGVFQTILPVPEDCMAVILPFRQLYSKNCRDDLFNRSCKLYARHCPIKHPTYAWIEKYRKQFNAFLETPVGIPLTGCNLTARQYLDAFTYGAKVVHVTSKTSTSFADWNYLLQSFPKELVILNYHRVLRELLHSISMATVVLQQNISYWINQCGWTGSSRTEISSPFKA